VRFPSLPKPVPFDENLEFTTTTWNVGYLEWDEVVTDVITPIPDLPVVQPSAVALVDMSHHTLTSNEVIERATVTTELAPEEEEPGELPETGASQNAQIMGLLGSLALMVGGALLLLGRRTAKARD
ncbi:MAG TPA: LPXTG cell wall anchor domain-containing protein, partial [Nocardioidaceae bacterium]|nr:LPXTG cell wall anchor domain-containing protein [Nocardioidaceae bacterium]